MNHNIHILIEQMQRTKVEIQTKYVQVDKELQTILFQLEFAIQIIQIFKNVQLETVANLQKYLKFVGQLKQYPNQKELSLPAFKVLVEFYYRDMQRLYEQYYCYLMQQKNKLETAKKDYQNLNVQVDQQIKRLQYFLFQSSKGKQVSLGNHIWNSLSIIAKLDDINFTSSIPIKEPANLDLITYYFNKTLNKKKQKQY